jgi:hypothetical protein
MVELAVDAYVPGRGDEGGLAGCLEVGVVRPMSQESRRWGEPRQPASMPPAPARTCLLHLSCCSPPSAHSSTSQPAHAAPAAARARADTRPHGHVTARACPPRRRPESTTTAAPALGQTSSVRSIREARDDSLYGTNEEATTASSPPTAPSPGCPPLPCQPGLSWRRGAL